MKLPLASSTNLKVPITPTTRTIAGSNAITLPSPQQFEKRIAPTIYCCLKVNLQVGNGVRKLPYKCFYKVCLGILNCRNP